MPELKKHTIKERAQKLTTVYQKHKGNKVEMAKELGITKQAVHNRLNNSVVGVKTKEILDQEMQAAAEKLGLNVEWFLKKLKNGADNATKVIGYLHQYKKKENGQPERISDNPEDVLKEAIKPDEVVSNEFIDIPDWGVQHRYIVTLGEVLKYLKANGHDSTGPIQQVWVGAEVTKKIKELEKTQVKTEGISSET